MVVTKPFWSSWSVPELIFQAFMLAMLGVLLVYLLAQVLAD
ncbi:putative membrane protein [Pseudomonas paraeruginosa]|uniref:Membrane protein n=1 Tax=Pseudomonas paraeruginosa TaxID=2994495 RepID=A0A2R3IXX9_9PSED|nr:putative membrane protein [Pseudomonas paraeruginosa]